MSARHFKSLLFKSTQIQQEIEKEQSRRLPDWLRLFKLKKLRLAIKDRLQRIARQSENCRTAGHMRPVMIRSNNSRASISREGR